MAASTRMPALESSVSLSKVCITSTFAHSVRTSALIADRRVVSPSLLVAMLMRAGCNSLQLATSLAVSESAACYRALAELPSLNVLIAC